ncbi:MAG: hypothetical protein AB8G22_02190, partial [Saprospiraceae bacterium]
MADLIEVKIVLDEEKKVYELQEGVSGRVVVRSNADLAIESFEIRLQYQQRGKLSARDSELKHMLLGRGMQWKAGQVYEYQFDNIYPNVPTYRGINGSLSWQLITYLRFSEQTRSKLQSKYLRKLKILKSITPERHLYANLPLTFTDNRPLQFPTQSGFL